MNEKAALRTDTVWVYGPMPLVFGRAVRIPHWPKNQDHRPRTLHFLQPMTPEEKSAEDRVIDACSRQSDPRYVDIYELGLIRG